MFNVYYRDSLTESEEREVIKEYFTASDCIGYLAKLRDSYHNNNLMIPRYSILPYARDMMRELKTAGFEPINTLAQFNYTADIREWYEDLEDLTFKTYFEIAHLPNHENGWVLKGETNSKKHLWNTHMRARNRKEAVEVMCRLQDDSLLSTQKIVARVYTPLVTYCLGPNGIPITNEWRCFCLGSEVLASGYYWHTYLQADGQRIYTGVDREDPIPKFTAEAAGVVAEAARRLGEKHGDLFFYVLDVAETAYEGWKIVEVNSGEMAGLADVSPRVLYGTLHRSLKKLMGTKHKWR